MTNPSTVARPYKIFMDGFLASFADKPTEQRLDGRRIENGRVIHAGNHYVDEPFIVKADDGAWVCSLTIGDWQEADRSQRTTIRRSLDQGRTWSEPVDIEPAEGPEGSKAVLLKVPGGRIYAFYIYNTDNLREVAGDNPPYETGLCTRVDSLGDFVFKYSDDHGRAWSARRYVIPMRTFEIDAENPYQGRIRFGMNSAIPCVLGKAAYVPFTKVGRFGEGLFSRSEGVLFKSDNILTERDPDKITWETLPAGRIGLRAPEGGGPIAEEHSFAPLSDGTLHCVFRTIAGWSAVAYSRDGGYTWTEPDYMRYADGRRVKCPRSATFAWKCRNGQYLYWFHNHGGPRFRERIARNSHYSFENRNPVWLAGGVEVDGPDGRRIQWSQPEIALYTDDPIVRISYPDLLEDDGRYFVTETNKDTGRIHELDPVMLEGLWRQFDLADVAEDGLVLEVNDAAGTEAPMPWLPDFCVLDERFADYRARQTRQGFSLDFWVRLESLAAGQLIVDNRADDGRGFWIHTTDQGTLEIALCDGMTENRWACDPNLIEAGQLHHAGLVIDGGPHVITFVIDGAVCDGGETRQFGWGRFSPHLQSPKGGPTLRLGPNLDGAIPKLRLYDRALRNTEVIGNWRAGL